ncbi:MAG: biopolymer transporter ExbD [Candidatus Binatia bacterium]|nr:MAG: biopolymer transporter ExbD [Candidatus Binatia bacterium]
MALGSLRSRARSPIVSEINITPLTDIFLVLLIIFMVTSASMVESGANVTLPRVEETATQPRELTITVTPSGELFLNAEAVTAAELEQRLREELAARPDIPVVLEGDRSVLFGDAVRILSIAQAAGAAQIAIAAERAGDSED